VRFIPMRVHGFSDYVAGSRSGSRWCSGLRDGEMRRLARQLADSRSE